MKIIFRGKSIEVTLRAQKSEETPLKNVRLNWVLEVTRAITLGGGTKMKKTGFRLGERYSY